MKSLSRRLASGGVGVSFALGLALALAAPAVHAGGDPAEPAVVPPADWEVEEAVEVLRRYLTVRQAERGRETGRPRPDAVHPAGEPGASADPFPAELGEWGITTADAPAPGNASLTISDQLHLAESSALFKNGTLFLWSDTSGGNLGLGRSALASAADTATDNTAVGQGALQSLVAGPVPDDGSHNTAVGSLALLNDTTGHHNTAVGSRALFNNTTGRNNVALGHRAGYDAPTDSGNNVFIANAGDAGDTTPTIRIGEGGVQTRTFIAGIHDTSTEGSDLREVCVDDAGQLGGCPDVISSIRFKQDVSPLETVTGGLLDLRPVRFRYREGVLGGPGIPRIGLIAEEVAELFPELVVRDGEGEPRGVRYELLSVLLLDALQRHHRELADLTRRLAVLEERQERER